LEADPGLYGTWNYALKKARADLIANANLDDRRNPCSLELQAQALENDATVDLVYSDFLLTYVPHETFEENSASRVIEHEEFRPHLMNKCLPGPQPLWRKSLHTRFGFFDESFKIAGDLEFWNRVVSHGVCFKKVPGLSGLYYYNPCGISTDVSKSELLNDENMRIVGLYQHMWQAPV
jgi:hypothetical protein